jgi:hypothetical protein
MTVVPLHREWLEIGRLQCKDGEAWIASLEIHGRDPREPTGGDFFRTMEEALEFARDMGMPSRLIGEFGTSEDTIAELCGPTAAELQKIII